MVVVFCYLIYSYRRLSKLGKRHIFVIAQLFLVEKIDANLVPATGIVSGLDEQNRTVSAYNDLK